MNIQASGFSHIIMQTPNSSISLLQQFRKRLPWYGLGGLMLVAFQLSMNRIDWLSKQVVDQIFSSGLNHSKALWLMIGWMFALALVAFVSRVLSRKFTFSAGRDTEYELRQSLLFQLHRLGFAFYRKMPTGEIMSRATNDLTQVRMLMGFGALNIINVGLALASAMQIMLSISVRLTLVCLCTFPLLLLVTRFFASRMFKRTRQNQEALGSLSSLIQSHLAGIRVIRSFDLEETELRRFDASNEAYLKASLSLARLRGAMFPIAGAISAAGMLVFFWYGGQLLLKGPLHGGISQGGFFAFSLSLIRMAWPMIAMGFVVSILQRGKASYARLQEIFKQQPEVTDGFLPAPEKTEGQLTVKNLGFSYGDTNILSDIQFTLPQGKSLAIVGPTGSGKTTLGLLLSRLLPTPQGTVFLDGVDICDLPLAFVHKTLGYSQQDAFLFSTTVAGNIGFALKDKDSPLAMDKIRQAAKEAHILQEIESLPEQFDTVVGERGIQLSGGQKQRISLARALLSQPKILILDDPFSAVDAKTEAGILETLSLQAQRSGLILITHRIAAASRCDIIIVLDQGKIAAQGTHEQLMKQDGIYARFANEQQMERELETMDISSSQGLLS